jgi:hypothetical protein
LPEIPLFDFETWFEHDWWPQYPRKVEKAATKKLARAIVEGRRRDGLKATPDELLAGVIRYAAAMTEKDPKYAGFRRSCGAFEPQARFGWQLPGRGVAKNGR